MPSKTKTKPEQTNSFAGVGVAKASKAIKKEKTKAKAKKDSVALAASNSVVAAKNQLKKKNKTKNKDQTNGAQSPKAINGKAKHHSETGNSSGTVKRHKKKDAKRFAKGGKLAKTPKASGIKDKTKHTNQGKKAKDNTIDHGAPNNTAKTDKAIKKKSKKIKAIPDDENIKTSESESEQEDSATQVKTEVEEKEGKKGTRGPEYTIFIGNLPPTTNKRLVRNLFKKYGTIMSVRFRTNTGVFVDRKDLRKATAINCYVRFATKEDMAKACELDGHTVEQNRIRVTPHDVKPLGSASSTIFVGNLRAGTTDSELYDFFSTVGEIEYVRQIANRYVAYVCFKKGVSIKKAFKLDQQKLNGRPIRVQQVDPKITNLKLNKKGHLVKKNRLPNQTTSKDGDKKPAKDFHGQVVNAIAKKKKKKSLSKTAKANRSISEKLKAAMNVRKK